MDPGFFISDVLLRFLAIIAAEQSPVGMVICFVAIADEFFTKGKSGSQ
jgi:hypothetical protein